MRTLPGRMAGLLLLFAGHGEAGVPTLVLEPAPQIFTGTHYSFDAAVHADASEPGPYRMHIRLPEGVVYRDSSSDHWSCMAAPYGAQDVECASAGSLPPDSRLTVHAEVEPDEPPGPAMISATLESDRHPLPREPDCPPWPSRSGCTTATTMIEASALSIDNWGPGLPGAVATWPGPPFEAGSTPVVAIGLRNIGYGEANSPVVLKLDLPPHISYTHIVDGMPGFSCAAQPQGRHETVTCTTAHMYDSQVGVIRLALRIDPHVPVPGPADFHVAVGNDVQPLRTNCGLDPHQQGCGRLRWTTRPAHVAAPGLTRAQHFPVHCTLGGGSSPSLAFANTGEGHTTATTIAPCQ